MRLKSLLQFIKFLNFQLFYNLFLAIRVRLALSLNNFAKTPDFRFWQKSGGRMSEIIILSEMSGQNDLLNFKFIIG